MILLKAIHRRAPTGGLSRYKGGQFIDTPLWNEQKQQAKADLSPLLERLGDSLQFNRSIYEQNCAIIKEGASTVKLVSLSTIEARIKADIRGAYEGAFLLGKRHAGNLTAQTKEEGKLIHALRADEFTYLRGFLGDIRAGNGTMSYTERMDMYKAAARELFNLGFVVGNIEPGRTITWRTGPTEHCKTCLRLSDYGAWPVLKFIDEVVRAGFLPQSGRLDCLGYRCQCRLEEGWRGKKK